MKKLIQSMFDLLFRKFEYTGVKIYGDDAAYVFPRNKVIHANLTEDLSVMNQDELAATHLR